MNISLIAVLAKRLIAVCVVSLIIWHITHLGSEPHGKAIVYAPRQKDVVMVNDCATRPNPSRGHGSAIWSPVSIACA